MDPSHLFKLRLVVARFGEMDRAGWWNTRGVLSGTGRAVLSRGFSHTHYFAQARIACSVATVRCQSIFNPPGCITLWNIPAEIDDSIEQAWPDWCQKPEQWNQFFDGLAVLPSKPLVDHLLDLSLIEPATAEAVATLKRSAEGRSVALPGTGKPDARSIMLLAAAFSKGEPQKPVVPYLRLDA